MAVEQPIAAGAKVKLKSTGEFGVVVHAWWDSEMKIANCYVAFFGGSFPVGKPESIPYVLRYAESSLERVPA
jgi:hypothetical protein